MKLIYFYYRNNVIHYSRCENLENIRGDLPYGSG